MLRDAVAKINLRMLNKLNSHLYVRSAVNFLFFQFLIIQIISAINLLEDLTNKGLSRY